MIIDLDKVKKLINNSSISSYLVFSETGISKSNFLQYRNGKLNIDNMTIQTAIKLQTLQEKIETSKLSNVKIKGIKKTVSEFNRCIGTAKIYFDTEKLTVWTNIYNDCDDKDFHQSKNIFEVISNSTNIFDRDNKITIRKLQEACEIILKKQKMNKKKEGNQNEKL